ncbi:unnamed protein product [Lampetra planeri]
MQGPMLHLTWLALVAVAHAAAVASVIALGVSSGWSAGTVAGVVIGTIAVVLGVIGANGEAVGRVATHGAPSGHPSGDDVGVAVTSQRNLQRARPDPRRVKVLANQLAAPRGARDERELARMFTTSAACG